MGLYLMIVVSMAIWSLCLVTCDDPEESGIKCYECTNADVECISLRSFPNREKFLKPCPNGCAVRLAEYGHMKEYDTAIVLARGCDDLENCDKNLVNCCKCDTDGCNINNDCSTASRLPGPYVPAITALVLSVGRHICANWHPL